MTYQKTAILGTLYLVLFIFITPSLKLNMKMLKKRINNAAAAVLLITISLSKINRHLNFIWDLLTTYAWNLQKIIMLLKYLAFKLFWKKIAGFTYACNIFNPAYFRLIPKISLTENAFVLTVFSRVSSFALDTTVNSGDNIITSYNDYWDRTTENDKT